MSSWPYGTGIVLLMGTLDQEQAQAESTAVVWARTHNLQRPGTNSLLEKGFLHTGQMHLPMSTADPAKMYGKAR